MPFTLFFFAASVAVHRRVILRIGTFLHQRFADFKLHAARVRVCVGLAALAGVSCGVGVQPVLEGGVVGADKGL